jgi:hypothetical protein
VHFHREETSPVATRSGLKKGPIRARGKMDGEFNNRFGRALSWNLLRIVDERNETARFSRCSNVAGQAFTCRSQESTLPLLNNETAFTSQLTAIGRIFCRYPEHKIRSPAAKWSSA